MENLIKIAADSVNNLRKSDVYRVLEQNNPAVRNELARFVADNRPDLAEEVFECLIEINS